MTARPLGASILAMNDAQAHRGPDGEGVYLDGAASLLRHDREIDPSLVGSVALGHRRLAILDPKAGHQPMVSPDGDTVVLFNGEIYNFRALREELKKSGCEFRTDSDTEVLVHLYRQESQDPGRWIRRLNGIFAFAIWDKPRQRMLLVRDHFGVKPLHVLEADDGLYFASEIKSLLAAGHVAHLNDAALHAFLNIRFVPGEDTLFRGVKRLPPASYAWVENGKLSAPESYYTLSSADTVTDRNDALEQIHDHYYRSVEQQMVSDAPLGIALSGGLDSSMNVAAAHHALGHAEDLRTYDNKLRTFTLGFNEPTDENDDAQRVADAFGTEHHDTKLKADPLAQARDVIRAVEEPKVNMIQGYELARFVQPHVKVLLSGLGGDELFAGYDIHRFCNTLGRFHGLGIPALMQSAGKLLWRMQQASGVLKTEHYRIGAQIALSLGDRTQFYLRLRNAWSYDSPSYARLYADPDRFRALPSLGSHFEGYFQSMEGQGGNYLDQVLRAEFHQKMVNDFLINEDRVTSAHGVEGRVPFLDRDFVELAFRLPVEWKMSGSETKSLWKDAVGAALPPAILNKKKQGFTFSSYHQWIKDLRDVVKQELTEDWCRETGLFNYRFIKELLDYPPHANLRWHYFLAWKMLGVKQWMEIFEVKT